MLDRQPKLAHRLATTLRPVSNKGWGWRSAPQPAGNAALQARGVQDADGGEVRQAVLPPLLAAAPAVVVPVGDAAAHCCACVIFPDGTRQQLPRHMGPLFRERVVCAGDDDGDRARDRMRQGPRYAVHGCTRDVEVGVGLKRRLSVRLVQQDRRGGRVIRPGRLWLREGVSGGSPRMRLRCGPARVEKEPGFSKSLITDKGKSHKVNTW
jgi:hypothetical protein